MPFICETRGWARIVPTPVKVKSYWWREVPNFGDALSPLLLARFGEVESEWATISHAQIASIGSILEHIPPLWDGIVLGSGKLFESSRLHSWTRTAKILAIRGPLSAKGLRGSFALGDPGLLAAELVGPQEKQWDLGIIPHWSDKDLVAKFVQLVPKQYSKIAIAPNGDPLEILRIIGACKRIVTSSLHGMIVADSFGIPRRIEKCAATEREGKLFKFADYAASIQTTVEFGKMTEPSRERIEDAQSSIWGAYQELRGALEK